MSEVFVVEGTQHVHQLDARVWAVNVSAITAAPTAVSTAVAIYDMSAGGASVTTGITSSGSLRASGSLMVLPTLGPGWRAGHEYRVDFGFSDGSGNTLYRSIPVKVDH